MSKHLDPAVASGRSFISGIFEIPAFTARSIKTASNAFHGKVKKFLGYVSNEAAIENFINEEIAVKQREESNIDRAIDRISSSPNYNSQVTSDAPYGRFHNRPIIGEDSPIIGGIYLCAEPHEALVIDEKYGLLFGAFAEFKEMFLEPLKSKNVCDDLLLDQVMIAVKSALEWNKEKVEEINNENNIQPDQKVALDIYLSAGYGVARHHVLMGAYFIQRLINEQWLKGVVSIDTTVSDERIMYASQTGDIYVLDFSKNSVEVGH